MLFRFGAINSWEEMSFFLIKNDIFFVAK